MKRTRFAALVCIAIVLIAGCHKKPSGTGAVTQAVTPGEKPVVISSADCSVSDPQVKIHRNGTDHVRWSTAPNYKFEVDFPPGGSPCYYNASGGNPVPAYYAPDNDSQGKSRQCFAQGTPAGTYPYKIKNLTPGTVHCPDPAVIVEN